MYIGTIQHNKLYKHIARVPNHIRSMIYVRDLYTDPAEPKEEI